VLARIEAGGQRDGDELEPRDRSVERFRIVNHNGVPEVRLLGQHGRCPGTAGSVRPPSEDRGKEFCLSTSPLHNEEPLSACTRSVIRDHADRGHRPAAGYEAMCFVTQHPGCLQVSKQRARYSDHYRRFVLELHQ
jgi:hypothetical protein